MIWLVSLCFYLEGPWKPNVPRIWSRSPVVEPETFSGQVEMPPNCNQHRGWPVGWPQPPWPHPQICVWHRPSLPFSPTTSALGALAPAFTVSMSIILQWHDIPLRALSPCCCYATPPSYTHLCTLIMYASFRSDGVWQLGLWLCVHS